MCRVRSTVKTCVVMIIYAESVFLRSLDLISRFDKKIMPKWYAKNVNREELEEFLGLLFLEGLHRSARVNYGNLEECIDVFHITMSSNRSLFLLRVLRFVNKQGRQISKLGKFALVRLILTCLEENY